MTFLLETLTNANFSPYEQQNLLTVFCHSAFFNKGAYNSSPKGIFLRLERGPKYFSQRHPKLEVK